MDFTGCSVEELIRLGEQFEQASEGKGQVTVASMAEQMLCVRDRSGKMISLVPNRVQLAFEGNRGQRNIVLKARQMGISTWVAGRFFLKTITQPGTLTVQVAHTQAAAESIFRIVHRFFHHLPEALRDGPLRTSRANTQQIIFPAVDSEYRVETAGDPNAGRGLTITNLHCSEVARWPGEPSEVLQGLRAALSPTGEMVLESTPMGASGCFWKEWQEAKQTGMVPHFFPWWWEDAYVMNPVAEDSLTEVELKLIAEAGLNLGQIGFRRQLHSSFRGLAKQEYAEDAHACFLASGNCVFDVASVDMRRRELNLPIQTRLNGTLHIWFPPVPGMTYLVAVDPAGGGTEGDYSVAQVVDMKTGLQCAELQTKLDSLELAQEVAKLAGEYNEAVVVVERNNHGSGVLAYLKDVCRYPKIYHQDGKGGWFTSSISRPRILGDLGSALVETPNIFSSERFLKECRSFVRHENGRTEAQAGEHDDCVMAMAIALAVRSELLASK